jgi:hypothetical protein
MVWGLPTSNVWFWMFRILPCRGNILLVAFPAGKPGKSRSIESCPTGACWSIGASLFCWGRLPNIVPIQNQIQTGDAPSIPFKRIRVSMGDGVKRFASHTRDHSSVIGVILSINTAAENSGRRHERTSPIGLRCKAPEWGIEKCQNHSVRRLFPSQAA